MKNTIASYGRWPSPLGEQAMFERPSSPMFPRCRRGSIYWIEGRAKERGRQVLVRREQNGAHTCLTPVGYNIRSRVHEYGGQCFALADDFVYFCNFDDQRLYRQRLAPDAVPQALTPALNADGSQGMYADLQVSTDGRRLVFVYERSAGDSEHVNAIGALNLEPAGPVVETEPVILAAGHDFFANPVLSADGELLAFIWWDHPYMPWDTAALAVARMGEAPVTVAGGGDSAVCQLAFDADGVLVFAMDRNGPEPADDFWNLYAYDGRHVRRIMAEAAEYGAAHWIFDDARIAPVGADRLLGVRTDAAGDTLVAVDTASGASRVVLPEFNGVSQVVAATGCTDPGGHRLEALCVAAGAAVESSLIGIHAGGHGYTVLEQPASLLAAEDISIAEPLSYRTDHGGLAHAYYYPPRNHACEAPAAEHPPLMVMVHGGPTSRTQPSLSLLRQYWTTRGFAVLDVNHRGSTGYGRRYRQALAGRWGDADVADVAAGVRHLVDTACADPSRVCIRGGSAGGYVVLRALTEYPQLFAAGACYYGIGNLVTLAETTHKFEAHYMDSLLGETYSPAAAADRDSVYYRRSPIHFLDRLRSPMIVFQGLEDRVVPPQLSRELVASLQARGIAHEYVEYPGEGHGFRRSETRIDALQREAAFYARVFSDG